MTANFHEIFISCSWRNTNSKYFTKIWQLIKYFLSELWKKEKGVVFLWNTMYIPKLTIFHIVTFIGYEVYNWCALWKNANKKFELMLTGHVKAYSSSCSQTVSLSPAISSRLLRGYHSLMPLCAGFFEHQKSRLGLSKSTFNAENFICCLSMSISIGFGAFRSCNVSRSLKSPKKIHKTAYFGVQGHSSHWIGRQSRASVQLPISD